MKDLSDLPVVKNPIVLVVRVTQCNCSDSLKTGITRSKITKINRTNKRRKKNHLEKQKVTDSTSSKRSYRPAASVRQLHIKVYYKGMFHHRFKVQKTSGCINVNLSSQVKLYIVS